MQQAIPRSNVQMDNLLACDEVQAGCKLLRQVKLLHMLDFLRFPFEGFQHLFQVTIPSNAMTSSRACARQQTAYTAGYRTERGR